MPNHTDSTDYHKNKSEPADDPNPLYLDFNFDLNYDEEFNYHQQTMSCHDPNAMMNVSAYGVEQQFFQYAQQQSIVGRHQEPDAHHALEVAADPNGGLAFVDFSTLVGSATNDNQEQLVYATANDSAPIQYYIDETSGQLMIKEQLNEPEEPQIIVCKPKRVKQPVKRIASKVTPESLPAPLAEQPVDIVEPSVCRIRAKRKQTHSDLMELLDDDFDFSIVVREISGSAVQEASPQRNNKVPESIAGTPFRPSKRLLEKNWKNWSRKRLLSTVEPSDSDDWKTDQECEMQSSTLRDISSNQCDDKPIKFECVECKEVFRTKRLFVVHKKQCNAPESRVDIDGDIKTDKQSIAKSIAKENIGYCLDEKVSRKIKTRN